MNSARRQASSSNSDLVIVPHIPIHGPLPPPSPTDSDIDVPLPPSVLLLPEDESDGVTSGAVQPPGSTGDPIVRTLTRDSSDSSDGTSFSEDEVQHMVDEQAEEERLIRNGGAGIPIGPVCAIDGRRMCKNFLLNRLVPRTVYHDHYFHRLRQSTSGGSVSCSI